MESATLVWLVKLLMRQEEDVLTQHADKVSLIQLPQVDVLKIQNHNQNHQDARSQTQTSHS